jgi:hypothetical protein
MKNKPSSRLCKVFIKREIFYLICINYMNNEWYLEFLYYNVWKRDIHISNTFAFLVLTWHPCTVILPFPCELSTKNCKLVDKLYKKVKAALFTSYCLRQCTRGANNMNKLSLVGMQLPEKFETSSSCIPTNKSLFASYSVYKLFYSFLHSGLDVFYL